MRRALGAFALAIASSPACASSFSEDPTSLPPSRPAADPSDAGSAVVDSAADAPADAEPAGATVEGEVALFDAAGGATTSVVLAPESFGAGGFFDELPAGPRARGVTGAWKITNVPAGTYTVLAGAEDDGLVPAPESPLPRIVVSGKPGEVVVVPGVQALVRALPIVHLTPKSTAAAITVGADVRADGYDVSVVDWLGKTVYAASEPPAQAGAATVTFAIGADLTVPLQYRVRVTAKKEGAVVTRTEDLAGVFTAAPDDV